MRAPIAGIGGRFYIDMLRARLPARRGARVSTVSLTHSDVAEIIRAIDASDLDEVVIAIGDLKVEVRRRGSGAGAGTELRRVESTPAPAPAVPTPPSAAPGPGAASLSSRSAPEPVLGAGQVAVRSPMVGTFYRRPAPEEAPFVEVGSEVEAEAPLCLVEVMKLFTTVYAPGAGRIAAICVADGEPVEYDQLLFVLAPD